MSNKDLKLIESLDGLNVATVREYMTGLGIPIAVNSLLTKYHDCRKLSVDGLDRPHHEKVRLFGLWLNHFLIDAARS